MEWILCPIIIGLVWILSLTRKPHVPDLREELGRIKQILDNERVLHLRTKQDYHAVVENYTKLQKQKKSSEVKTGLIVEQIAGFMEQFPYPDAEIKALYQPVDMVVFKDDEIVFVEIKSGESNLSEKQKKIRDLIEEKKVRFEVHRINGKGYNVK